MYISAVQSSADLTGCLFSTRSSGGNAFGDPSNFQGLWQRFEKTEVGAALSTVLDWRCYMVGWFGLLQIPRDNSAPKDGGGVRGTFPRSTFAETRGTRHAPKNWCQCAGYITRHLFPKKTFHGGGRARFSLKTSCYGQRLATPFRATSTLPPPAPLPTKKC